MLKERSVAHRARPSLLTDGQVLWILDSNFDEVQLPSSRGVWSSFLLPAFEHYVKPTLLKARQAQFLLSSLSSMWLWASQTCLLEFGSQGEARRPCRGQGEGESALPWEVEGILAGGSGDVGSTAVLLLPDKWELSTVLSNTVATSPTWPLSTCNVPSQIWDLL